MGETKPTRVVLRETWVLMKEKSRSYAKGFAGMGFLYSGTECMIERYRAKHDAMNATLAGCATGGLLAAPGGWEAVGRCVVDGWGGVGCSGVQCELLMSFQTGCCSFAGRVLQCWLACLCAAEIFHARLCLLCCPVLCCAVLTMLLPPPSAVCAGGAKAMCFGCASFAAFSTAIEYFTGGM